MLSDAQENTSFASYTLEKKENDIIVECSVDMANIGILRKEAGCCFERLQDSLGKHCDIIAENTDVDLVLDIPEGNPEEESLHKIFVMGSFCSGKSLLIKRYVHNIFRIEKATIGVNFYKKTIAVNNNFLNLQIWETTGNTNFLSMLGFYLRGTSGIVLTIDLTRDCERELKETEMFFREYILRFTDFPKIPVILVGTKSDIKGPTRIPRYHVEAFAQSLGIPYLECSASTGENVSQVFELLTKMVITQQSPRYVCRIGVRPFDSALVESPEFLKELYRVVQRDVKPALPLVMLYDIESLQYHQTVLFFKNKDDYDCVKFYLRCIDNYCLTNSEKAVSALVALQKEKPTLLINLAKYLIRSLDDKNKFVRRDNLKLLSLLSDFVEKDFLKQSIVEFYGYVLGRGENASGVLNVLTDLIQAPESLFFREEAVAAIKNVHQRIPAILMSVVNETVQKLTSEERYVREKSRESFVVLSHFIDQSELRKIMINFYVSQMSIQPDTVLLLNMVSNIASLDESINKMLSILFFASVTKGYFPSVRFMIKYCDVLLNLRNAQGKTAFMIASEKGYKALADYLLKEKAKQLKDKRIVEEDPAVEQQQFRSLFNRK